MAVTLRQVADAWVAAQDRNTLVDFLVLPKAQQLVILKAYAAVLRDEVQTRVGEAAASKAALQQQAADLNTLATS